MLVLRTSNFQGATIRQIVQRHKHSIVFTVYHYIFSSSYWFKRYAIVFNRRETLSTSGIIENN